MAAVDVGSEDMVQLLLDKGAEVNATNKIGKTVLFQAVTRGHAEFQREQSEDQSDKENIRHSTYALIVHLLLKKGGQINSTSSKFNPTTAHLEPTRLMNPNTDILKILLAAGAEL